MDRSPRHLVNRLRQVATVFLLLLAGTVSPGAHESSPDVGRCLEALIDGHDRALGAISQVERSELQTLYAAPVAPLWFSADGRQSADTHAALAVLKQARDDGLNPGDYHLELLGPVMAPGHGVTPASQDLARADIAISAGLLRYLRDVHVGRVDPRTVGFRLDSPRDDHDFVALLRGAMISHRIAELVAEFRPPLAQYRLLRAMLPRYRVLAADTALIVPQPITRAVRPGEDYGDVAILRHELIALGDLRADTPPAGRYDGAIVDALKHFQLRHGLAADGVLGKSTVAALRVPAAVRLRQIEVALERLRWVPHVGDARLIALNAPMFRLWAWDTIPVDGTPLFAMDAIVGRALRTETPVFAAEMREVTFRPYWNVPTSILHGEVLPKIIRDPDYLRREDMEIVRGAGDDASRVAPTADSLAELRRGQLRVRQRPGAKNALGLIKFVFPNSHDVYMHGTPAQSLFARDRRDFSHGCVRVADPIALAEWVLRDAPEWTRDRIVAATTGTRTIHVKLSRPIQVILFYTTAAVMPEDGTIRFADDIYRRDAILDRALDAVDRLRGRPPAM